MPEGLPKRKLFSQPSIFWGYVRFQGLRMTHSSRRATLTASFSAKQLWAESCHHTARSGALPWQGPSLTSNLTWLRLINQKRGIQVFWSWEQTKYKASIVILQEAIPVAQLDISDEWIPMWGWSIGCISTTKICKIHFSKLWPRFQPPPKFRAVFTSPFFFRCVHVYVHWVQHGTVLYGVKTIVTSWTKSIHRYRWWLDMAIDASKHIAWPVEIDLLKLRKLTHLAPIGWPVTTLTYQLENYHGGFTFVKKTRTQRVSPFVGFQP